MSQQTYTVLTVTLEDREDGGLRVFSDDLRGLVLSGADKRAVCNCIIPAIRALLEARGLSHIAIHPARSLEDVIKRASPRDLDVHVQHEQFVVEVLEAA